MHHYEHIWATNTIKYRFRCMYVENLTTFWLSDKTGLVLIAKPKTK